MQFKYELTLSKYERDNLLFLLNVCGYPNSTGIEPFTLMNSGDWIGQIAQKLSGPDGQIVIDSSEDNPNRSPEEIRRGVAKWKADSMKCKVTKNLCGTDTWQLGHACSCENCQEYLNGYGENIESHRFSKKVTLI